MRSTYQPGLLLAFMTTIILNVSCVKDRLTYTYKVYTPVMKTLTQARAAIKSGQATAVTNPGKITVYGNFIFLSEAGKGIHVIDNSDPVHPKNVSFINIPGNEDMAIRGNTLYADNYGDLVTFDIGNAVNAIPKKFLSNIFSNAAVYYADAGANTDSILVVVDWLVKDTTVTGSGYRNTYPLYYGCASCAIAPGAYNIPASSGGGNTVGINGSTARFAIISNYLYTVDASSLSTFDLSNSYEPQLSDKAAVDWHVETIYPFKNNLFVGTNNGVYMFDITSSPGKPVSTGSYTHARGCDPVIADTNYAYVTLNDGSACLGFNNELQIINIRDMSNSFLVQTYQLTHPEGLSKDGTVLFVCDGKAGLKIYDCTDAANLNLLTTMRGTEARDIIAVNGLAILLARDGLYEYDYTDINNVHLISKL